MTGVDPWGLQKKDDGVTVLPPVVITAPRPGPIQITIPNNGRPITITQGKPSLKISGDPGSVPIFDYVNPYLKIGGLPGKPTYLPGVKLQWPGLGTCDLSVVPGSKTAPPIFKGGLEFPLFTFGPVTVVSSGNLTVPLGPNPPGKKPDPILSGGIEFRLGGPK
jgi:hypothetical protein